LVDEPRGFAEGVRDANLVAPLTFRYHLRGPSSNLDGIVDKIDELCLSSLALHAEMNIWSSFAHQLPVYLHEYGAFVLFAIIMFEAGGLPLPGETALVTASALATSGDLNILHVTLAAIGGAVVGDNVGYAVGRYAGRTAVVKLFTRFGVAQRKPGSKAIGWHRRRQHRHDVAALSHSEHDRSGLLGRLLAWCSPRIRTGDPCSSHAVDWLARAQVSSRLFSARAPARGGACWQRNSPALARRIASIRDPPLMIRMLLVGYCHGISSEHRLNSWITRFASRTILKPYSAEPESQLKSLG
jgi:membrane protein YqaA with SNARE-associated domain